MAITFNSPVVIWKYWTDFKSIAIISKSLPVQYDIDTESSTQKYVIFSIDGDITYTCYIWLGTISPDVLNSYSQDQNDIDRADFEANYLNNSNIKISVVADNIKSMYDLTDSSVIYIGTAPLGTLTNDAAWLIKKVSLDINGNPTSILWSGFTATWDNRSSETYN